MGEVLVGHHVVRAQLRGGAHDLADRQGRSGLERCHQVGKGTGEVGSRKGSGVTARHVQFVDELLLFGGGLAGKGGERKRHGQENDPHTEAVKRQTKPA